MTQERMTQFHRQVGVFATLWLVLCALSALALNHRALWSVGPSSPSAKSSPYGQYLLSHAESPHTPGVVLVGTSEGLFLSADSGKSFHEVALPVPAVQVVGVAFHPTNVDQFYVALRQGLVFSSQDGGKKWDRVPFPGTSTIHSFSVAADATLAVLTPQGLYRRTEDTWNLTARPAPQMGETRSRNWLRWAYNVHDGQIWGPAAGFVTDCLALAILFLVISGLWMAYHKVEVKPPHLPQPVKEQPVEENPTAAPDPELSPPVVSAPHTDDL